MTSLFDPRRLAGRLFYLLVAFLTAFGTSRALPPATTTINDIVYRADGTPAGGTLLITWPQFTTSDNKSVAAGTMNVPIGSGGAVNIALAPNAGASPAGTFYKIVYKLDDGTSSTEYWTVPATSPTTIAAIRSTVVPASMAVQMVSRSYVDGALGTKATDSAVVHKSGDTMSGLLTLSADPTSAMHAATKSYVDSHAGGVPGQIVMDGTIYPTIHAAVVAAGTSGSVLIPANYAGADTDPNPNKVQITDLRGKPNRQRGFINVLTDCGLKGDGVTDDSAAVQACFNAYPGYFFMFPQTQANGTCSYWLGATVYPKGHGGRISGASGGLQNSNTVQGGTMICSPAGVTPFWFNLVDISGGTMENISLVGSEGTTTLGAPTQLNLSGTLPQFTRSISSIQRAANVLTVTVTLVAGVEGLTQQVGSTVKISGVVGDTTMNGNCVVTALSNTAINPATFTCNQNGANAGPFGAVGTVSLPTTGASTADGIRVCTNFLTLKNVVVANFGRHGINADSSSGNGCPLPFSDDLVMENVTMWGNQGNGFYCQGGDCNAGTFTSNPVYYNVLWGMEDQSSLGNTHVGNQISNNGHLWASTTTPATKNISTISRTLSGGDSTVTVVLSQADTNLKLGSCVVIAGVTDTSFNTSVVNSGGCFFLTSFTDSTHFQYIQPGAPANASSSGGTSRMAKFSEVYLAAGVDDGAAKIQTQSAVAMPVLTSTYVEGGQNCKFGSNTLLIGGANVPVCAAQGWTGSFLTAQGCVGLGSRLCTNITAFDNKSDSNGGLEIFFRAGVTTDQPEYLTWADHNLGRQWRLEVNAPTSGAGSWILYGPNSTTTRRFYLDSTLTRIDSLSGAAVEINKNGGNSGTGGLEVWSGGASPTVYGKLNSSGLTIGASIGGVDNNGIVFGAAFKSSTANPASAGAVRLAQADALKFRNIGNSADLTVLSESSDVLQVGEATNGINVPGPANFANLTASGTVSAAAISTGGDSFAGTPRIAWGSFLPGALSSTWTAAQLTPKKGINVVQVDLRAKTAPAGCTTFPVVQITDGTTPINVSLNSAGVSQSVTGGQNYAASSTVQVKVSTAGAGCTTNAADVNVTVQYKMQ